MNTVSVVDDKTGEVIASITDYSGVIRGICKDGYSINVDGEKLERNRLRRRKNDKTD